MPENHFLDEIKAGRTPIQAWMWNPSVLFTEVVARAGFDSVGLDLQHGAIDFDDLYALMTVLSAHGVTPMVRVPQNDPSWITRVLDGGAYGVICPDVRTAEEAEAFVSACKYAPQGERGYGPARPALAARLGGKGAGVTSAGYSTSAENDAVMAIIQIESPEGLENVEAIMSTPGVDGIFPGLVDYSLLAYGEVLDYRDPRLRDDTKRMTAAAHAVGKPVGLAVMAPDDIPYLIEELGADWLQFGNDLGWMIAAAQKTISDGAAGIEASTKKS